MVIEKIYPIKDPESILVRFKNWLGFKSDPSKPSKCNVVLKFPKSKYRLVSRYRWSNNLYESPDYWVITLYGLRYNPELNIVTDRSIINNVIDIFKKGVNELLVISDTMTEIKSPLDVPDRLFTTCDLYIDIPLDKYDIITNDIEYYRVKLSSKLLYDTMYKLRFFKNPNVEGFISTLKVKGV